MAIRRWDPLPDLLRLQERVNRVFEESLARLDGPSLSAEGWTPLADVYETAEGFVVLMELPGIEQDDVEVDVDGDRLALRGHRRMSAPVRPDSFHRMERSYGRFSRSFQLTAEVDPARVTAQFRDGLLRLDLPKARPQRPSRRGA